ncbi:PspA/IM30 family protein [Alkalinema pantanalense CENA528]|uniref:PspA/IM30 family protein n=1 Tax=Alkalinema pantanalense TaxID=1620705 RepID=UPI003D6ED1EE
MRSVVYWLMGDRAGRVICASWNWLWGKPIEQGGKLAVEVAQESLHTMQQSVYQLTESVAKAVTAYERAKQHYLQKQAEAKRSEQQATQALEKGQEEAARLAMARAIEVERVLPKFAAQVHQAEQAVQNLKDKLHQERQKLESYQVQMQTLKALAEVNEALAVIADINSELHMDSARSQFQEAQAAIEGRNIQVHTFQELTENSVEKLQTNLDQISLDSEIEQRFLRLKANQNN